MAHLIGQRSLESKFFFFGNHKRNKPREKGSSAYGVLRSAIGTASLRKAKRTLFRAKMFLGMVT